MGTADSIMVSMVGESSLSAVSLVDSLNLLILMVFSALAAGGSSACAHALGQNDRKEAAELSVQLVILLLISSLGCTAICLVVRKSILALVFGQVEKDVMQKSITYFGITILSYPFIALFSALSAISRADQHSTAPMMISVIGNIINIICNYFLIFINSLDVVGAALATLFSRVFCAVVMLVVATRRDTLINFHFLSCWKFNLQKTPLLMRLSIPFGVENGMFQLGKLAVQSTVSTMGTIAISAQALTSTLESFNSTMAAGVGLAMIPVVGQCLGAGKIPEAKQWVLRMTLVAEATIVLSCILTWLPIDWLSSAANLSSLSATLCKKMLLTIVIIKPILWAVAFVPAYGMRTAGDGRFVMITSMVSMWCCRVALTVFLAKTTGLGPFCVWIGMFMDWFVRAVVFSLRFRSGNWLKNALSFCT